MRLISSVLVLVMIVFVPVLTAANEVPLILLEDGKSKVEDAIGKYLHQKGWKVQTKHHSKDYNDVRLLLEFTYGSNSPEVHVVIDTSDYSKNKNTNQVMTKRIKIFAYSPQEKYRRIKYGSFNSALNWVNDWNRGKWAPGGGYIDGDNDLVVQSFIVLRRDVPVHAEQIYQHIDLISDTATQFFKQAANAGILKQ